MTGTYVCQVCGQIYGPAEGVLDAVICPGTAFDSHPGTSGISQPFDHQKKSLP
ncbi:MAG: rubredoxin [Methanomicrobiales archaeon]